MGFKERIKSVIDRKCSGVKAEFARTLEIDVSTIALWDDDHTPRGDTLERIHTRFGVDLHWLLTGQGDPYIKDAPGGEAKDKGGLWGTTVREVVDGQEHMVTLHGYPSHEAAPDLGSAVNMLSAVLSSGDDVLTHALMANLIAFSRAAQRDKEQASRIHALERECDDLKQRLERVESHLGTLPPQEPLTKTGASKK